jgi:hypothetical protein
LTFCMSTFWLNSGGNLVLLRSFASTPVAIAAGWLGFCLPLPLMAIGRCVYLL